MRQDRKRMAPIVELEGIGTDVIIPIHSMGLPYMLTLIPPFPPPRSAVRPVRQSQTGRDLASGRLLVQLTSAASRIEKWTIMTSCPGTATGDLGPCFRVAGGGTLFSELGQEQRPGGRTNVGSTRRRSFLGPASVGGSFFVSVGFCKSIFVNCLDRYTE